MPLIYRVHDEPTLEKVHNLQEFLTDAGIPLAKSGAHAARLSTACWRRQRQIRAAGERSGVALASPGGISAENFGHFGLNL